MAEMLDYSSERGDHRRSAVAGTVIGWASLVLLLPVASMTAVRARIVMNEWFVAYVGLVGLRFVLAALLLWGWHVSSPRLGRMLMVKLVVEGVSALVGASLFAHYIWGKKTIPSDGLMALTAVVGDALVGLAFPGFLLAYRGRGGVRTRE